MAKRAKRQRSFASSRVHRRGYTLVFFAMMLFGIMAMAALVIDIGFARLTQRQMQIAADSAAVEGLRGEGVLDYDRRWAAARDFVHWHFDDNLDSTGTYPADDDGAFDTGSGLFGAGPLVEFSGGAADPSLVASQFMAVDPANPVHKPVALDGTQSAAGSFHVALRRGTTDTPTADLYANGPAVPYLFARGSLINRQLINNGITVRGTGRAESRRALSIGIADDDPTPALPGLVPLTLELSYWNGLRTSLPDSQPIAGGVIGISAGRCFAIAAFDTMPLTIGRMLPAASVPADGNYTGYVPIYAEITASSTLRVVGFGKAEVVVSDSGTLASIIRLPRQVGAENASAVRCFSVSLTAAESDEVFTQLGNVQEPLLAPASR